MLKLRHNYTHELNTLKTLEYAFTELSEKHINKLDLSMTYEPLINLFQQYGEIVIDNLNLYILPLEFERVKNLPKNSKVMVVCASGGKDSTAVAKFYKDLGYRVILYHMKGINKVYQDEYKAVDCLSAWLKCEYHIEEVKLTGTHDWIEHPMKNYMIANGAIQYCLDNNLPLNIAFGNYDSSRLEDMDFEIDAGDSRDMWDIYELIVGNEIPNFRIYTPLNDISETYKILDNDLGLFEICISCMSPYRFREYWKQRTETKYGVKLMENRCGCCYKCCLEYMVLADKGYIECNQEYYMHCFEILRKTAIKETKIRKPTVDEVWNRYMWYPMSKSHMQF